MFHLVIETEEYKVIYIHCQVQWWFTRNNSPIEDTWFMLCWLKSNWRTPENSL
jgi:hypothetical protein